MKIFTCSVMALLLWAVCMPAAQARHVYDSVKLKAARTEFTKSIEDLPVMLGLEIVEEKDVFIIFGSQRIAQTTLKGHVDIDSVYYFYDRVLRELGWKKLNAKTYQREGERLFMRPSSANKNGITYVRFDVEPRP